MSDCKIGILGCAGRMGRMLIKAASEREGCSVGGGTEPAGSPSLGKDLGELAGLGSLAVSAGEDTAGLFAGSDVVIDFTAPAASVAHAALAAETGTALLIGTTGLNSDQIAQIEAAGAKAPVLLAANMSLGVNLLLEVVEQVAAALDEDYDIEVLEMHHRHKVDAPSGTALALGNAAAAGRGVDLDAVADKVRDGIVGARKRGDIGFATLRGGDVPGEHSVIFAADGERVILSHKASNREVFSRGAITAALWLNGRSAGFYSMKDVLGLSR
ncbi:4-hydroxy-tetrahydrodipicolinate reductase [Pelagibius sp. Alg239-R121]|uniref:4-hydroxy-tetrahydrodipicolinate reductase n=1 Tax=Pelagibius sp. Alg239-R121 TaxID=2993448 RepID=UPI0024A621C6|nr:4-hydroxy-tetrahydrodipicolinate reductase [Pelagibius sp. Alg239-R121]